MFDFNNSLAAHCHQTELKELVVTVSTPLDVPIDPSMFENAPVNRIDLP